jgi:hypothetical protein
MTKIHHENSQSADTAAPSTDDGQRIEGAADEIFARAHDAVRDVAERATHLAQDTLERGRAGIRQADRSTQGESPNGNGRRGTSPLATALAVGAMGYAIATLIRGATRKRAPAPENAFPEKDLPTA